MNNVLVVIPHYNDINGLRDSILSIQDDVDILVIDDGSIQKPDNDYFSSFIKGSQKLFFIINTTNRGISYCLNRGIDYFFKKNYTYFARLDAGDRNIGPRFAIQKNYLEENMDIGFCGSYVRCYDINSKFISNIILPCDHELIIKKMYLYNCFIHPSIMIRKNALQLMGYYPINYLALEDYYFFWNSLKKVKAANINKFLLIYTISSNSISTKKRLIQSINKFRLSIKMCDFSLLSIFGIIKNFMLIFFTRSLANRIKKLFKFGGHE